MLNTQKCGVRVNQHINFLPTSSAFRSRQASVGRASRCGGVESRRRLVENVYVDLPWPQKSESDEPGEEGVEADAGHVVDGQDDLLLQEVVGLSLQDVEKDLQEIDDQIFRENRLKRTSLFIVNI
jgi:hypothetical protein